MKRISFLLFSLICAGVIFAQNKSAKAPANKTTPKVKYPYKASPVYLGNTKLRSGNIPKRSFDSLVAQGLTAVDSAGTPGKVIEFRIYYKERNLYEDSLGNYYTDIEMLTDLSKSNKLNSYVVLQDRTKKGDTAIFDDILVLLPDSVVVQGVGMKFVIDK
jgi:hypothetical protein